MTEEIGWVIERGDSEPSRPWYWNGTGEGFREASWTDDNLKAVRFARQVDAQTVAHNFMGRAEGRIRVRICD